MTLHHEILYTLQHDAGKRLKAEASQSTLMAR
jgi:hypothetical protein